MNYQNGAVKGYISAIFSMVFLIQLNAQNSFFFNKEEVKSGTKKSVTIEINSQDVKTEIPITIFHGIKSGPVLGITAGVHGYEYPPILAGQQLLSKINPMELEGTVILVHISNVGSFLGRSPFTNPLDDKNLNRTFPGNPEGSVTERIADFISKEVIAKSDYFLDMHGGDASEDLTPYGAYYRTETKKAVSEKGRKMAMSLGFDKVIVFQMTDQKYFEESTPARYCSGQAFKNDIPSIDIECGRLGIPDGEMVDKIVTAVENLLKHLKMIPGDSLPIDAQIISEKRSVIKSKHQGIFYPLKKSDDYVVKGMKLGYITDFFGNTIEEIHAKENGLVLYIVGTPPINKGETLASIAIIKKDKE